MTQRSEVPNWARNSSVPNKATKPQVDFVKDLAGKKQFPDQATEDRLWKMLRIWEDPEELGMNSRTASATIDWLKKQPNKAGVSTKTPALEAAEGVPAGRYAVDSNEGELRFYHLWRPKDNPDVFRLYVLHGPDSSPVFGTAMPAILNKIKADIEGAMARYGHEIGSCSVCGRRLTNRISRELGIGPVCGGRVWDDFDEKHAAARQRIVDRGEDPDEEVE